MFFSQIGTGSLTFIFFNALIVINETCQFFFQTMAKSKCYTAYDWIIKSVTLLNKKE